jgi:adenine-specific DNA-methyltransferase
VTGNDIFDNRLIFGDNLLALKALEHEFTGRVKCITSTRPTTPDPRLLNDDGLSTRSGWG